MLLLTQLRWLAVGGQLITVAVSHFVLGIDLPLLQLLMSTATLAALNIASHVLIASGARFSDGALAAALLFDVGALTVQLSLSGGITNPFAALFLLHIVLGAVLLRPYYPWTIVAATLIALGILALDPTPLVLPATLPVSPVTLYLTGGFVCFVLIAVVIDKPARRAAEVVADERVLLLEEDLFLVGYGMDYAGRFRNLPELRALELGADGLPLPLDPEQAR